MIRMADIESLTFELFAPPGLSTLDWRSFESYIRMLY